MIVESNNDDHSRCFHTMYIMKMGRLITQNSKHLCNTFISTEEYLCKQIKKIIWEIEVIFMQALPTKVPDPHKKQSISTSRETSMSHSLSSQSREEKPRKIHAARDIMDKGKSRQNHIILAQQAVSKPCVASTLSKNYEALGLDQVQSSIRHKGFALAHEQIKKAPTVSPPLLHILGGEGC